MINSTTDKTVESHSYQIEDFNEEATRALEEVPIVSEMRPESIHGRTIASLASNFYCAKHNAKIHDLAEWLVKNNSVKAVGIIDHSGQAKGVIVATELFNILSTKFGRELHFCKTLDTITRYAETFNYTENIFSIASKISKSLMNHEPTYFLLKDQSGRFSGLFSTHDMLVYLSNITSKDIHLASKIQSCVVPEEKYLDEKTFRFMARTKMAKGVGGDFYTAKKFDADRWFFALCDVSGKGMSAALMSITIGSMVHMYDFSRGLKSFVESVNEYFFKTFGSEQFATGVFIDFNENSGKFEFCDAGHSMLYLMRSGQIKRFRTKDENPPLGIRQEFSTNTGSVFLKPGDMVALCTDGIDDQKDPYGKRYGVESFLRIVNKNKNSDFAEIVQTIFSDIKDFSQNQPQDDDISIMLLEYRGTEITQQVQSE